MFTIRVIIEGKAHIMKEKQSDKLSAMAKCQWYIQHPRVSRCEVLSGAQSVFTISNAVNPLKVR